MAIEAAVKLVERDAMSFAKLATTGNKETDEQKRTQRYQMCSHTGDALADVRNELRAIPCPPLQTTNEEHGNG